MTLFEATLMNMEIRIVSDDQERKYRFGFRLDGQQDLAENLTKQKGKMVTMESKSIDNTGVETTQVTGMATDVCIWIA